MDKKKTTGDDLTQLQGTWTIASLEIDGQETPASMVSEAQIVIKGNRFKSSGMGAVYEGTLELRTSQDPHQIEMKFDAGPEKGNTNPGIYKLDGDRLELCLATRGTVRPSQFASPADSGIVLEVLQRGAARAKKAKESPRTAAAAKPSATAPATEFEGEWQMVSGVMNGAAMDKSTVQWVKRVTTGNETIVYAGPQVMMKMQFTSDSSKSPKTIDYINTGGANKGKSQQGIFEFEGDTLKVCMAAPGSPRPARFESTPGDGATFTIWKKI